VDTTDILGDILGVSPFYFCDLPHRLEVRYTIVTQGRDTALRDMSGLTA